MGRILLVAIFPVSAYYKIIGWPGIVSTVEKAGLPYALPLGAIGTAAEMLLPILVIVGLFTRWAALGLIVYVIAATYIGHPVLWRMAPDAFFGQLMGQMKNLAMIGGLLLIVGTGPGRLAIAASARCVRGVTPRPTGGPATARLTSCGRSRARPTACLCGARIASCADVAAPARVGFLGKIPCPRVVHSLAVH